MIPRKRQKKRKEKTNGGIVCCLFVFLASPEPVAFKELYLYSAMALGRSLVFFKNNA